jgi:signal transduction histidine kinase
MHLFKIIIASLVFILFFLLSPIIAAQNPEIDSIKQVLNKLPEDTNRIIFLNAFSRKLCFTDPQQALIYCEQMLRLAQKFQKPIMQAQAYVNTGVAYDVQNRYSLSIEYYFKALQIFEKYKFSSGIATCFNNIANAYSKQDDLPKAMSFYHKALVIKRLIKDKKGIGVSLNNIATTYDRLGKLDSALIFHNQSLAIKKELNDYQGIAFSRLNIGSVYYQKKENLSLSLDLAKQALESFTTLKNQVGQASALGLICDIYIESEKYLDPNVALEYAQKRLELSNQLNSLQTKVVAYRQLSRIYALMLNYEKAFEYKVLENIYTDSLNTENSVRKIERMKYEYELGKKDIENQRLLDLQKLQLTENERLKLSQENFRQDAELQLLSNKRLQLEQKNLLQDKKIQAAQNDKLQLEQKSLLQDKKIQTAQIKLDQETIQRQRLIGIGVISVLIMMSLVAWAMYRNYQIKQRDNQLLSQQKEEITQQNEAIHQQNLQLEEINHIKDKLFSVISHDFRSPLNSLQGVLHLLNEGVLSEKEIKFLSGELGEKVGVTLSLLDNLLNWSKNQMQGIKVNPKQFALNSIVEDNFRLFKSQAEKKQVKLINQLSADTMAFADPDMINIVLRNLIANAVKFTESEDEIRVATQQNGEFIQMSVQDTGRGIKAEHLGKIFKPDTYFTTLGTANEKGNGLGLQIVQDFVIKNGGRIWVESQEGQGSTFHFTLPHNNSSS